MQEMGKDRRLAPPENTLIPGSGLRRRFPGLAEQLFRPEDPAQESPDRNALLLGNASDGTTMNEVINQNAAVCRRKSSQRLTHPQAALRFFHRFHERAWRTQFNAVWIIEGVDPDGLRFPVVR